MAYLTNWLTAHGTRWAMDGRLLPDDFVLRRLLERPASELENDVS